MKCRFNKTLLFSNHVYIDSKEWPVKDQEQKRATWYKYERLVTKEDLDEVTHH